MQRYARGALPTADHAIADPEQVVKLSTDLRAPIWPCSRLAAATIRAKPCLGTRAPGERRFAISALQVGERTWIHLTINMIGALTRSKDQTLCNVLSSRAQPDGDARGYARQMVQAEELHAGEVDKMLRQPGDVAAFRPNASKPE